jgi:hypothetical protein
MIHVCTSHNQSGNNICAIVHNGNHKSCSTIVTHVIHIRTRSKEGGDDGETAEFRYSHQWHQAPVSSIIHIRTTASSAFPASMLSLLHAAINRGVMP